MIQHCCNAESDFTVQHEYATFDKGYPKCMYVSATHLELFSQVFVVLERLYRFLLAFGFLESLSSSAPNLYVINKYCVERLTLLFQTENLGLRKTFIATKFSNVFKPV